MLSTLKHIITRAKSAPLILSTMIILPAFSDFLRKMIPGQPNTVTPVIMSIFMLGAYFFSKRKGGSRIPAIMNRPFKLWISFLLIYLIITFFYSFKVGSIALVLRFVPFLAPLVAFRQIKTVDDLENAFIWVVILIIGLFPISLYSILNGNESLPKLLQPIDAIQEIAADTRGGFDICSAIFSTGAIMAFSVLACFYNFLALALIKNRRSLTYIIGAVLSLVIMYSTVRRSTLYFASIGVLFYLYLLKKKGARYVFFGITLISMLFLFSSEPKTGKTPKIGVFSRVSIIIDGFSSVDGRVNNIFIDLLMDWLDEKPFGSFLGYAGREAGFDNVPRSSDIGPVETGSAQLVAETGFFGFSLYVFVFIWIWKDIYRYSKRSKYRDTILMIMVGNICIMSLFLMQMASIQFGMYMSQIIFWMNSGIAWALIKSEKRQVLQQRTS